jgi:hypothetical protein
MMELQDIAVTMKYFHSQDKQLAVKCHFNDVTEDILTFLCMDRFFTDNLLILQFYIYIQLITCIRNTKSKYRCTTYNISTSNFVRATDSLR